WLCQVSQMQGNARGLGRTAGPARGKWGDVNGTRRLRLSNYPRTESKALRLHKLEERRARPGGPSHDSNATEAQDEEGRQTQAVGDYLGSAGPALAARPAPPGGVLADQAHGPAPRQLAEGAQRHHLPDAFRLPVGPLATQVRSQEHRPRLVPALVRRRGHATHLGSSGPGVRRTRGRGLAMAGGGRTAGQSPVRGKKRWGKTPRIAGKWAPRKACWLTPTVARWGRCWPQPM